MRVTAHRGPLGAMARMAAAFAASDLLRGAIRLVMSLAIARGLGPEGFGRWTLYAAWASALTVLFDLGFGVLLTREAARDEGRTAAVAAGAAVARTALFVPVAAWLCIAPGTVDLTPHVACAIAALAAAGLAYGCVAAVFRASPARLLAILGIESAAATLQCLGSIAIVGSGGTAVGLLWFASALLTLQSAVAWTVLVRAVPGRVRIGIAPRDLARLVRRALPFAAAGVIANTRARLGPLMLGAMAGPSDVASFGVATRLDSIARQLPNAAFGAALPVFSSAAAAADRIRGTFNGVVRLFAVASGALLIAAAGPLVSVTYGRNFDGAIVPLMWAGAGLVPSLVNSGRKVYLNATGRERVVARWSAVAVVIQAGTAFALIPRFGASGAMVALAAGELAIWAPLKAAEASDVGETVALPALPA